MLAFVAVLAGPGAGQAGAAASPSAARVSVERVTLTDARRDIARLRALGLEVTEDVTPSSATVIARSDDERAQLRALGHRIRTVTPDVTARLRTQASSRGTALRSSGVATARAVGRSALPSGRTGYRTPAEVQGDLDRLVATSPGLVRPVVLPQRSVEGRPITGVEIARNVNAGGDGRPVYLVFGLHHAREWPSAEIATEFALSLVAAQSQPRVAALLDRLRVIVVPVVNPDGYAYSRGGAVGRQLDVRAALKRRNCRALPGDPPGGSCAGHRGVDLNRNYGAYWGGTGASTSPDDETFRGTAPWSEPEAAAVHELSQGLPVTGVQSLHNIAGLVLRPPGFRALGPAPDEPRLKVLGDAMGAATGYASRFAYELYDVTGATEDWNYIAQGAFGYTIETAGAYGGDPDFQGGYATHVTDQFLGGGVGPGPAGQGVREALLLGAEQAADRRDHTVIRGRAPAGSTLRLRKRFLTTSSPLCSDTLAPDACGPSAPAVQVQDGLDTVLTVGADGAFAWHVGPSTRPFVRAAGRRETWTLSCSARGVAASAAKRVFADRGQVVDVHPCEPASLPRTGSGAGRAAATRVSVGVPAQRAAEARRRGFARLLVRCPAACRVAVRATSGGRTAARAATLALRARRTTTLRVPLTLAGRRQLARGGQRTFTATVTLRTREGNATTMVRRIVLRAG